VLIHSSQLLQLSPTIYLCSQQNIQFNTKFVIFGNSLNMKRNKNHSNFEGIKDLTVVISVHLNLTAAAIDY